MVIQRVITMSDDTFTQSGNAGAPPGDAEYNAVFAAVTATERGRWFLAEFANRTRKADTDVILAAIARVEDPDAYNAPITMLRTWFKVNGPMLETICAENNGDMFRQNLYPIPQAKTPDF